MPAWSPRAAGVKLVTVNPANPEQGLALINGVYVLFERESLQPIAIVDAAALTEIRTGAVSGVATRCLSRPDSSRLVIFGAGAQARGHLEAMCAVRPIEHVTISTPSRERGRGLFELGESLGVEVELGEPKAVAGADIVCTCTTSPTPVFTGADLDPGAHVNAVGSYKKAARELDSETVGRAVVVAVERLDVAMESGDIAAPTEEGILDLASVVDLASVLDRPKPAAPEITVFKSVGRAFEDLAVAELLLDSVRGA